MVIADEYWVKVSVLHVVMYQGHVVDVPVAWVREYSKLQCHDCDLCAEGSFLVVVMPIMLAYGIKCLKDFLYIQCTYSVVVSVIQSCLTPGDRIKGRAHRLLRECH